jgi:hypothetical protein
MANALMFFISGIYFIVINFSYTNHRLKAFDNKVHDFMVIFIFAMFGCLYEYYNKFTDLDYTGTLKYAYKIKNMDENHEAEKK